MKIINQFICGDALAELRKLPEKSVDMCMTSPPYYGLRDYGNEQIFAGDKDCEHTWGINPVEHDALRYRGHNSNVGSNKNPKIHQGKEKSGGQDCIYCGAWKGQLGLEPMPEMYIKHLTEIFNEVKRALKKEGTFWLNIGDTYGGSCQGGGDTGLAKERYRKELLTYINKPQRKLMPKCLLMIPERLAWALIQDGWILRNKIIWYKPNAMPSSVTDRFSNRWEYIFLFSKSQRYYFDLDAVRVPHAESGVERAKYPLSDWKGASGQSSWCQTKDNPDRKLLELNPAGKNPGDVFKVGVETRTMGAIIGSGGGVKVPGGKGWTGHPPGGEHRIKHDPRWCPPEGKRPIDFWEINTQPFPEAHFAVFPEKLCLKPIKAGCPKEVCKKCGKARERILKIHRPDNYNPSIIDEKYQEHCKKSPEHKGTNRPLTKIFQDSLGSSRETIGWTDCKCKAGFEPGVVLDPFAGAGTVGVVAKTLGRRFILIDIKKEYMEMARKRVAQVGHQKELFE